MYTTRQGYSPRALRALAMFLILVGGLNLFVSVRGISRGYLVSSDGLTAFSVWLELVASVTIIATSVLLFVRAAKIAKNLH